MTPGEGPSIIRRARRSAAASYEAKAYGSARRWAARGPGALRPKAYRCHRGCPPTPKRARRSCARSRDTAPVVEGLSIDEAFLDVRGLDHISGAPSRSRNGCGVGSGGRSGCRSRSGSPGRSSWPRSRAWSRSRTNCCRARPSASCVPAPVAGRGAVGRRRVTAAPSCPSTGSRPSVRSALLAEPELRRHARPRVRASSTRAGEQLRPGRCRSGAARRSIGGQRALGRRRRSPAELATALRARRPGLACRLRAAQRLPDRRAADTIRGLLARNRVVHHGDAHRSDGHDPPNRRTGCSASMPLFERRGLTLRIALTNLTTSASSSCCRFDRARRPRRGRGSRAGPVRLQGDHARRARRP